MFLYECYGKNFAKTRDKHVADERKFCFSLSVRGYGRHSCVRVMNVGQWFPMDKKLPILFPS